MSPPFADSPSVCNAGLQLAEEEKPRRRDERDEESGWMRGVGGPIVRFRRVGRDGAVELRGAQFEFPPPDSELVSAMSSSTDLRGSGGPDTALDPTQLAAQEQFSRQSQRYGKGHILENIADVDEALSFLSLPSRARVLDVACGAGHTGLHLASFGHGVTCADLSPAMLDRAREGAAARSLTIDTQQHAAESMPYSDASFDLVTCRVAPHHFSSPSQFVREVARVLRSGGWFLLIDGTIPDDESEAGEWLNRVEKLRDPSHVRLIAPAEWCRFCTDAGLQVERHWLRRKKQPDLNWYFETAATSEENRREVLALIDSASSRIREIYDLAEEDGKIVWQWPMLSLLARK